MQPSIRVGIVDDHAVTRYAVGRLISEQEDMVLADEACDGNGAVQMARRRTVDVMVLDLMMPGTGGLDVLPMVRAKAPDMGVLVFSSCPASQFAVNVLRRGAGGYLSKQCEPGEILQAVRALGSGHRYISPAVADLLASNIVSGPLRHPHERLTDREFQLLLHFARGGASTQIADDLALSPKTVSTYRSLILNKLSLKSNSEMTHYAMVHGLID